MENIGEEILTKEQRQQVEFFRLMFTSIWGIPKKPEEQPERRIYRRRNREPSPPGEPKVYRKPIDPEYFNNYYHAKKVKIPCPNCGKMIYNMNMGKHLKNPICAELAQTTQRRLEELQNPENTAA
jgi:hypothetical protein